MMAVCNVSMRSNAKLAWLHNAYARECLVVYLVTVKKRGHVGSVHVMHKIVKHTLKVGRLFCEGIKSSELFDASFFVWATQIRILG
jgi:hypothetical protein